MTSIVLPTMRPRVVREVPYIFKVRGSPPPWSLIISVTDKRRCSDVEKYPREAHRLAVSVGAIPTL